jgi:ribosome-binding factor A
MARTFDRKDRISDEMHRLLATIIQQELRDPEVGLVSITRLTVSRDLAYAKVYFIDLSGTTKAAQEEALNRAAGFMRSKLARLMRTRTVPALTFVVDEAYLEGERVKSLLNKMEITDEDEDEEASDDDSET